VRQASRLLTNVLLTCGTAGAGSARMASAGSRLGQLGVPVLSLSANGVLALRAVAVPAGQLVAVAGQGPGAFYVLHMASRGAGNMGGKNANRSTASNGPGPGRWRSKKFSGPEEARRYQEQITGRAASELYYIDEVEFDGFSRGMLLEAKGPNYKNFFQLDGEPEPWFLESGKFDALLNQASKQSIKAQQAGLPLTWHVADAEVVGFLREHFNANRISGINIVHTTPLR
jgi:hypothetical protein